MLFFIVWSSMIRIVPTSVIHGLHWCAGRTYELNLLFHNAGIYVLIISTVYYNNTQIYVYIYYFNTCAWCTDVTTNEYRFSFSPTALHTNILCYLQRQLMSYIVIYNVHTCTVYIRCSHAICSALYCLYVL